MVIPEWALGVSVIIFASMVAKIVLAKLRASTPALPGLRGASDAELGELRQALEATQQRLGEVEERLDFTERLLAGQRDADRREPPPP
jgi:hypothetical protein